MRAVERTSLLRALLVFAGLLLGRIDVSYEGRDPLLKFGELDGERACPLGTGLRGNVLRKLVESSLDFWLTTGRFSAEFEKRFSREFGRRYAALVNSGSSGCVQQPAIALQYPPRKASAETVSHNRTLAANNSPCPAYSAKCRCCACDAAKQSEKHKLAASAIGSFFERRAANGRPGSPSKSVMTKSLCAINI